MPRQTGQTPKCWAQSRVVWAISITSSPYRCMCQEWEKSSPDQKSTGSSGLGKQDLKNSKIHKCKWEGDILCNLRLTLFIFDSQISKDIIQLSMTEELSINKNSTGPCWFLNKPVLCSHTKPNIIQSSAPNSAPFLLAAFANCHQDLISHKNDAPISWELHLSTVTEVQVMGRQSQSNRTC